MRRALGLLLLAATACSGGYGPAVSFTQQRVAGIPVLAGHTRGPGEALPDGLVVPAGSVLLGEPLKAAHPLSNVRRWQGAFVLTGSVAESVGDLRDQLGRLGYRIDSSCEPNAGGVSCKVRAVIDQPVGGRRLVWADAVRAADPPTSYLLMELTAERPESEAVRDWGSLIAAGEGPLHDAPLPSGWPALPDEGEHLFPDGPTPELAAATVPRGTSPVGPTLGPWTVLVQPEGDVADTFDDVVRDARKAIGPTAATVRAPDADEDGVRVRHVSIGERGPAGIGTRLVVTAIEQDGHPSYILFQT